MAELNKPQVVRHLETISRIKPTPESTNRALESARRALASRQRPKNNLWQALMQNNITRLAAAAAIIIAVLVGVEMFSSPNEQPQKGPVEIAPVSVADVALNNIGDGEAGPAARVAQAPVEPELEKVDRMFATNDVDGLVGMLSTGQLDTKVVAANYLVRMGEGTKALSVLEKLRAEHGPDDAQNAFTPAVEEVRNQMNAAEGQITPVTMVAKANDSGRSETDLGLRAANTRTRNARTEPEDSESSMVLAEQRMSRQDEPDEVIDGYPVRGGWNSVSQVVPSALHRNLVLYYSFYGTGDPDTVRDISGRGYNGKVHGAKLVRDDVLGPAMQFDGQDDHISIPDVHLEHFTFSAWATPFDASLNNRRLFLLGDDKAFYSVEGNTHNGLSVYVTPDTSTNEYNWKFPGGAWTHVTVTYDGAEVSIYRNGRLTERQSNAGAEGIQGTVYIAGLAKNRHSDRVWDGMIDEVALFNRALSETEVEQLYLMTGEMTEPIPVEETDQDVPEAENIPEASTVEPQEEESEHFEDVRADGYPVRGGYSSVGQVVPSRLHQNLVVYYSFYGGSDPGTVTDISGRGNHGRVHGAEYVNDDALGQAMDFDGEDDFISMPQMYLQQFSFSAWVAASDVEPSVNNRRIFQVDDGERYFAVEGNSGGGVTFNSTGGHGTEHSEYNWKFEEGIWTHIVVTYDGQEVNIYKFGTLTEIGVVDLARGIDGQGYIGGIGRHEDAWNGTIDEVAIFDRVLTEQEVEQLYLMTGEMIEASDVSGAETSARTGESAGR
ncbi:MAG: LamG domain-containing protein [Planctomycetota bacterium]